MLVLVISSVFFINLENMTLFRHFIACEIFIVSGDLVDQSSVRKDFHDTVGGCLYELMIVRGKKDDSREFDQTVIQSSDRFHVQMVGRLIKEQDVCSGDHHLG